MEKIFTDANFKQEVLDSKSPVFVDFWAPWCGPCQMMGPIVEELATEYAAQGVVIGKCNVDENQASSGEYGVLSIPTFMAFKDGKMIDQLVGGVPKEKLKEFIEKNK